MKVFLGARLLASAQHEDNLGAMPSLHIHRGGQAS